MPINTNDPNYYKGARVIARIENIHGKYAVGDTGIILRANKHENPRIKWDAGTRGATWCAAHGFKDFGVFLTNLDLLVSEADLLFS